MAREYIPNPCLTEPKPLSLLPPPSSEMELREEMEELAGKNVSNALCLIGAGSYRHFIPEAVNHATVYHHALYSGYTPYQAEAAQGVLCALYETYRMLASLTRLDLVTTHYDWSSALAEAARMAVRQGHGKRTRILVSQGVNPLHLAVLRTSLELGAECTIDVIPLHEWGMTDLTALGTKFGDDVAAVIMQTPNFFGNIEPLLPSVAELAHKSGALFIVSQYAMSFGVMCPGEFGADIAVSDLQPFGIPVAFGGPSAGMIAAKKQFLREIPGRIVNKTVDRGGMPAYRLGYQAREQHIRREKATSNICTNQNLVVLRAGAYLALMGPENLRKIAEEHCFGNAHHLAQQIVEHEAFRLAFPPSPFFNEFLVKTTLPIEEVRTALYAADIYPFFGIPGAIELPPQTFLVAATELVTWRKSEHVRKTLRELRRPS